MKPLQLDHTAIRVADLERSRRFYEGLLGLDAIPRPDFPMPGRWYGVGAGQLHLIQCDPLGTAIDPSGPHFAIQVDDLDAARREIAAAGLETLDPGRDQLWVRDPDGYTVEITVRRRSD
jgi:catechol 2,3-dioxygenase-like lactoylglutathione lyase family enzyme